MNGRPDVRLRRCRRAAKSDRTRIDVQSFGDDRISKRTSPSPRPPNRDEASGSNACRAPACVTSRRPARLSRKLAPAERARVRFRASRRPCDDQSSLPTHIPKRFCRIPCSRSTPTPTFCRPSWPNLAEKYGDDRFPVMVKTEGRHRIYKDGKFFREVWKNASIRKCASPTTRSSAWTCRSSRPCRCCSRTGPSRARRSSCIGTQRSHRLDLPQVSAALRRHRHRAAAGADAGDPGNGTLHRRARPFGRADRIAHARTGISTRPNCFRSSRPRPISAPRSSCIRGT